MESHRQEIEAVKALVAQASPLQRAALADWARELSRIRDSDLPAIRKGALALRASAQREILIPLLKRVPSALKEVGLRSKEVFWDNRRWPIRLAFIGLSLGFAVFGGKAAGLASMGHAIRVPLWLVLGAGGNFLGTLVEELGAGTPPTASYTIIEAHKVIPRGASD